MHWFNCLIIDQPKPFLFIILNWILIFLIRYWLIQTKDIESTLKNIGQYEEEASIIQYNAQFIVYARMLSEKSGELRICLITDDYAAKEDMFNANEGIDYPNSPKVFTKSKTKLICQQK